jgi:hypothetical protein
MRSLAWGENDLRCMGNLSGHFFDFGKAHWKKNALLLGAYARKAAFHQYHRTFRVGHVQGAEHSFGIDLLEFDGRFYTPYGFVHGPFVGNIFAPTYD